MTVSIGEKIPDFTVPTTGNKLIDWPQLRGWNVVIYFYPKDDTPGCTREGQDFRDHYPTFTQQKTVIIGVSRDSLKSHERFQCKYDLPFPLASDEDESLCTLFGVMKMKNMYGKQVRGIERSTFLIDRDGVLQREWRGVKVDGHVAEVLAAAQSL